MTLEQLNCLNFEGWHSITKPPTYSMVVKWKCIDFVEDIGFYKKEIDEFMTWDPRSTKEIFCWKPAQNN